MFARGILGIWVETGFPRPLTESYLRAIKSSQCSHSNNKVLIFSLTPFPLTRGNKIPREIEVEKSTHSFPQIKACVNKDRNN